VALEQLGKKHKSMVKDDELVSRLASFSRCLRDLSLNENSVYFVQSSNLKFSSADSLLADLEDSSKITLSTFLDEMRLNFKKEPVKLYQIL
jgi:hypothetical protein